MLTISKLAKQFHISRTSILYYEQIGLLQPACRSDNGYRWYGEAEAARLKAILAYRSYGVPLASLNTLLDQPDRSVQEPILQAQFQALEDEIQRLRRQQEAIVCFLQSRPTAEPQILSKERWVGIMRAAGFSETDMCHWHKQFEAMEPKAHQIFLESLQIDVQEIESIRAGEFGG